MHAYLSSFSLLLISYWYVTPYDVVISRITVDERIWTKHFLSIRKRRIPFLVWTSRNNLIWIWHLYFDKLLIVRRSRHCFKWTWSIHTLMINNKDDREGEKGMLLFLLCFLNSWKLMINYSSSLSKGRTANYFLVFFRDSKQQPDIVNFVRVKQSPDRIFSKISKIGIQSRQPSIEIACLSWWYSMFNSCP